MPMTLSGDGTITGLAAGGLPNGTVQPSDLSTGGPSWDTSGNLTPTGQIRGTSTGAPPLLADSAGNTATCRAWVNFNGTTSPGTIRASFNVSSVTKNGTGDYTVNFTNALPDANYSVACSNQTNITTGVTCYSQAGSGQLATTSVRTLNRNSSSSYVDDSVLTVAIFR